MQPQKSNQKEKWRPPSQSNKRLLWVYAGLAFQLLASLGVAVYAGIHIDKWLHTHIPLMVWILPLLVIAALMVKVIADTGKKRKK